MTSSITPMRRRIAGFTLIEAMIVVAIIAILAAIAYPSYYSHVLKTRRADGKAALVNLASEMEQYYYKNNAYPTSVGNTSLAKKSEEGHYTLAIDNVTARSFKLSATPLGAQANDQRCGTLTLDSDGKKGIRNGTATSDQCW